MKLFGDLWQKHFPLSLCSGLLAGGALLFGPSSGNATSPVEGPAASPPAHGDSSFEGFRRRYPLPPVRDYTFLGTELSREKPIVGFGGRIEGWFDPAERVRWVSQAIEARSFTLELVDGFLPALKWTYYQPGSRNTCEMTAFAVDTLPEGEIHVYIRLVERAEGQVLAAHHFRLKDLAEVKEGVFTAELEKLRRHWAAFFAEGKQFPGTEPLLLNAAKASLIRALISYTGKHPHYGVRAYGGPSHDAFPPTTIGVVNCLLDWGHTSLAEAYLSYYVQRFVTRAGRFDYYGPSLAEYGQMLQLVRRLYDAAPDRAWLEPLRPRLEELRRWLWADIEKSQTMLIAGVPEADTRGEVDVYFHNNAWCWRGLRAVAGLLGIDDKARCEAYRQAILKAIDDVTDRSTDPPFLPPVARRLKPFASMTQDPLASYTNYRYWLELLSSGILSRPQAEAIVRYRETHGGEVSGLTHFMDRADDWPIADYGLARLAMGDTEAVRQILFSHLAGHLTPETWTAYEQVGLTGSVCRKAVADYCVPCQLAVPRLLAAWRSANASTHQLEVPKLAGEINVDGKLDEACYQRPPSVENFVIAGQPAVHPQKTRAWLFWQPDRLVLAFDCEDADIVAAPASAREHDVDDQDRVEFFFWPGNPDEAYGCLELAPRGAVHDYRARFYRRFDDAWSPAGWRHAVTRTPKGYQVEATIPRAALAEFGLRTEAGARWRAGLFRADFRAQRPHDPVWITWVDAQTPEPDFHVAGSFGEIVLGK